MLHQIQLHYRYTVTSRYYDDFVYEANQAHTTLQRKFSSTKHAKAYALYRLTCAYAMRLLALPTGIDHVDRDNFDVEELNFVTYQLQQMVLYAGTTGGYKAEKPHIVQNKPTEFSGSTELRNFFDGSFIFRIEVTTHTE